MVAQIREQLGLDQPLLTQAAHWYGGLLHGDFGRSILLVQSVFWATAQRLPVTAALSLYTLAVTLVVGIGAGVPAALRQNTWVDQAAMMVAMLGISIPRITTADPNKLSFRAKFLPPSADFVFGTDNLGRSLWSRTVCGARGCRSRSALPSSC